MGGSSGRWVVVGGWVEVVAGGWWWVGGSNGRWMVDGGWWWWVGEGSVRWVGGCCFMLFNFVRRVLASCLSFILNILLSCRKKIVMILFGESQVPFEGASLHL